MRRISIIAFALSLLTGCDHIALGHLKPGESTSEDVRRELGEPSFVWNESHGQQVLEYAGVPDISKNYMMLIGTNGVLQEMRQVVVEDNFKRIVRGMSQDEVRRILGKPYSIEHFSLKQQDVWDWKMELPGTTSKDDWRFNVHFGANGVVEDISQTRSR